MKNKKKYRNGTRQLDNSTFWKNQPTVIKNETHNIDTIWETKYLRGGNY